MAKAHTISKYEDEDFDCCPEADQALEDRGTWDAAEALVEQLGFDGASAHVLKRLDSDNDEGNDKPRYFYLALENAIDTLRFIPKSNRFKVYL